MLENNLCLKKGMRDKMSYIEFKNVCKEYKMGEITIKALNNTNFSIEKGELVVIVGPSGARKNHDTKHFRRNGYGYFRRSNSR